jgi:LuxR family maltose regulon positive regulatory protein
MIGIAVLDAQGCAKEAECLREELRTWMEVNSFLLPNFMAYETRMRMMDGNANAAAMWLNNYFNADEDRMELCGIFRLLTTARAFMLLREPEESRHFLKRLIELAGGFGRVTDKAEAMTLLAILEWHRGDADEAVVVLGEAIASVQQYRYVRLFADEGASLLPILSRLVERPGYGQRKFQLNGAFLEEIRAASAESARKRAGIASVFPVSPPKLTKQQALMLKYLAEGYERSEISDRTNLSRDTIKFHITKLYKKLDVHCAADAVSQSRKMGLI